VTANNTFERAAIVALTIAMASGCASTADTLEAAAPVCGCSQPPQQVSDAAHEIGINGLWEISPQCLARDQPVLAGVFRVASRQQIPHPIAFWGRDSKLTRRTIIEALEQSGATTISMKLTFIGETDDAEIVRNAVIAKGGTYVLAPMLPNNTFERTVEQRGQRLAAASAGCPAAELSH